jgi:DNA-binding CsgD family transcriptional regulator
MATLLVDAPRGRRSRGGPDRWGPIELQMRRLMRETHSTRWVLAVFETTHDFIESYRTNDELHARTALDVIYHVPTTEVSGCEVFEPLPTSEGSSECWLTAAMTLTPHRVLRMALLASDGTGWWGNAELIGHTLTEIAPQIAASLPSGADTQLPSLRRRAHPAMYLLNDRYEVEFQWHAQDLASMALAQLTEPVDGHLPGFIESRVRRMTETWDLSDVKSCTFGTAYPIPGLLLRTAPMQSASRISIGVLLEPYVIRRTIEHTAVNLRVSSREREVLYLLLDGESISDIAAKLNIAESTVQDHVKRMILKTDSRNRVEMAAKILGWPSMRSECRADRRQQH